MKNPKKSIPFLYCKLDRAAKYLGCDVRDLIHLGVIGGIELCVILSNLNCEVITEDKDILETYVKDEMPSTRRDLSKYSYFNFKAMNRCADGWAPEIIEHEGGIFSAEGYAHGLWCLCNGINELEFSGELSYEGDFLMPGSNGKVLIEPLLDEESFSQIITINDIFITKEDVSRIEEDKIDISELKFSPDVKGERNEKLKISTTKASENKKDKLIKSLIEMFYGYGASEKIRSLINEDRNTGELLMDFQKNGIKPPMTSKTLATWLEDVDIERVVASTSGEVISKS